jgi:hypothetical protein
MAQLVERSVWDREIPGSSPGAPTRFMDRKHYEDCELVTPDVCTCDIQDSLKAMADESLVDKAIAKRGDTSYKRCYNCFFQGQCKSCIKSYDEPWCDFWAPK